MTSTMKKWLVRGAMVAVAAAGAIVASAPDVAAFDCPEPSAGTCPPLSGSGPPGNGSCPDACDDLGWHDGGSCIGGCCTCVMR